MLKAYLQALRNARATGAATPETSYYPALSSLLTAVGHELSPKVSCVLNLQKSSAGLPDGGFFTPDQMQRGATPQPGQLPSRGVIEVKPSAHKLDELAASDQVARYLEHYGQVFITNLWGFELLVRNPDGSIRAIERYQLAKSEASFWSSSPQSLANQHAQLFPDFLKRVMLYKAPLTAPKDVAWFLASHAREARMRAEQHQLGAFHSVKKALEEGLGIRFDDERGKHFFRSTLVQTLFYGIFSAWVLWSRREGRSTGAKFNWRLSPDYLHVPVLRKLFHEMTDRGSLNTAQLIEVLDHAEDTLNRVQRDAFFAVFADHEAVAYFYEPFLEAFDPELRKDLGVWYTPDQIVRYMVGRVDRLLRTELNRPRGLADPEVYILDPCCGTGAYLTAVLERIAATLEEEQGLDAFLADDLKQAAIERVFGFEILPAPFVVAHLQLNALLESRGAPLKEGERVPVFLTNALTGWEPLTEPKRLPFLELEEERDSAERVKRQTKILVVLGNPPYNSFAGIANMDEERDLTEAYRVAANVAQPQGQGLNDLYVRFFRMAERRIVEKTGQGIVCFISNYSWLDGLSFTAMRERYLQVFDAIWIDNLNGDKYKTGKLTPEGLPDPSAFSTPRNREGIQVGTAIATLVRTSAHGRVSLQARDLWGTRKLQQLADETAGKASAAEYTQLIPAPRLGLPFSQKTYSSTYLDWPKLPELFPVSFPGVKTSRDSLLVDIDRERLEARIEGYFDPSISDEALAAELPSAMTSTARYNAPAIRKFLIETKRYQPDPEKEEKKGCRPWQVLRFCYRPFDVRWVYWEPETKLLDEKRTEYVKECSPDRIWMITQQTSRRVRSAPQVIRSLGCIDLLDRSATCIPRDIFPAQSLLADPSQPAAPNLSRVAEAHLRNASAPNADLFLHSLAVMHSPQYQEENLGALVGDWPRIPLPDEKTALEHSANLGRELALLLDAESTPKFHREWKPIGEWKTANTPPNLEQDLKITVGWGGRGQGSTVMPGRGKFELRPWKEDEIAALTVLASTFNVPEDEVLQLLGEKCVDVWLNGGAWWSGAPERVWEYTLGGYQVLKKWLSYREFKLLERPLKKEEARYFTEVVRRVASILLMGPALDANYRQVAASAVTPPTKALP